MSINIRNQTCCFTGHRHIPPEVLPALSTQLETAVRNLITSGIRFFHAGGALGFDTLAAETVLRLRREFQHINLILVLPCRSQTRGWSEEAVSRYEQVLRQADAAIYISECYHRGCMHERNRHLVDHSSVCIAYCTRPTGGSAYTVGYARKHGLQVILLGRE